MLNICSLLFPRKRRDLPPHPKIPLSIASMSSPNEQSISDVKEMQKESVTEFYKVLDDRSARALNVTKASQCPSSLIADAQEDIPAPKLDSLRRMKSREDVAERVCGFSRK